MSEGPSSVWIKSVQHENGPPGIGLLIDHAPFPDAIEFIRSDIAADRIEAQAAEIARLRAGLAEAEARGYRRGIEDASQCCTTEADRCDDAMRWGGSRKYVSDCKAAAYAMRDRARAILSLGKKE